MTNSYQGIKVNYLLIHTRDLEGSLYKSILYAFTSFCQKQGALIAVKNCGLASNVPSDGGHCNGLKPQRKG